MNKHNRYKLETVEEQLELPIDEFNHIGHYGAEHSWIAEQCRPTPKGKEYRPVTTIYYEHIDIT